MFVVFLVYVFGSYVVGVLLVITILMSLLFGYCYCRRRGKVTRTLQNVRISFRPHRVGNH